MAERFSEDWRRQSLRRNVLDRQPGWRPKRTLVERISRMFTALKLWRKNINMFKWMWSYDEWITCRKGWEETRGTTHDNQSMRLSYGWQYTGRDKLNRIIHSLLQHLSVVAPLHYFFKWQTNLSLANFISAFELAGWRGSNPGDLQLAAPEISFFVNDWRRIIHSLALLRQFLGRSF